MLAGRVAAGVVVGDDGGMVDVIVTVDWVAVVVTIDMAPLVEDEDMQPLEEHSVPGEQHRGFDP